MATSNEAGLTERQADVLRLHREGKNPTDIGKEIGVSSQAVHGHLRKLRSLGFITEPAGPPRGSAVKKVAEARNGRRFKPEDAMEAVRAEISGQIAALEERKQDIAATIAELVDEQARVDTTIAQLARLLEDNDAAA